MNLKMSLFLTIACIFGTLPAPADAVQWEPLARTSRHNVAIDMSSVRLTILSRLAVWLRFTPLGEPERRLAAAEYNQKSYRLHLEYYEIDCSEQNAVMGMIDVLGPSTARISRSKGNATPDAIIPGSVLDVAMQRVCPSMEESAVSDNEEILPPENTPDTDQPQDSRLSEDAVRSINDALLKTEAEPENLETWRTLGNLYFDADLPADAISAYNKALAINPNETNILNDQGAMYRQIGDFDRALANFEKARSSDPNNLESLYNSGYVLAFDLNQIDKALVLWRQYLTLDSSSDASRQVQSFMERYGKKDPKGL